jgi:hypothetical protein
MLQWSRVLCALTAAVVLVLCTGVSGEGSSGGSRLLRSSYSVSQTHSLKVRQDALVDIVLTIIFHVDPGRVLSGSRKTILSDFGTTKLEGPVTITDGTGRSLVHRMSSNSEGWFKVEFDFAEPVTGPMDYTVKLAYTVSNGICSPLQGSGEARFSLPWAHRWIASVLQSKYEVAFLNPSMDMDSVCIGSSAFRPRCGPSGLSVSGTTAMHEVSGNLHGTYFDWTAPELSLRPCSGGTTSSLFSSPPDDIAAKQKQDTPVVEEDKPQVAMTVGIVAASSSVLLAGAVCICAHKHSAPHRSQKTRQRALEEMVDTPEKKDKLKLDLEEGASDSTVASVRESPTFGQRRPLGASPLGLRSSPVRGSLGNRTDTGAGLGVWDVPEEFEEEEFAALHEKTRTLQFSESPGLEAVRYGKIGNAAEMRNALGGMSAMASISQSDAAQRLRREQAVDIIGIDLGVADANKEFADPFALQDDFDDRIVEDSHTSVSPNGTTMGTRPLVPTMARFSSDALGSPKSTPRATPKNTPKSTPKRSPSSPSMRLAGQIKAAMTGASPSMSPMPRTWEVMEEYGEEDMKEKNQMMGLEAPGSSSSSALCNAWEPMSEFDGEDLDDKNQMLLRAPQTPTRLHDEVGNILQQNFLLPPLPTMGITAPPAGAPSPWKASVLPLMAPAPSPPSAAKNTSKWNRGSKHARNCGGSPSSNWEGMDDACPDTALVMRSSPAHLYDSRDLFSSGQSQRPGQRVIEL